VRIIPFTMFCVAAMALSMMFADRPIQAASALAAARNSYPAGTDDSASQPLGSSALLAKQLPSEPTHISAISGDASATVQWTEAVHADGPPITRYLVTPYLGTRAHKRFVINMTGTTAVLTGLRNGVPFGFRVAAENSAGAGPQSAESNVITIGAPTAPTHVVGTMIAAGELQLTFRAPATNGATIHG